MLTWVAEAWDPDVKVAEWWSRLADSGWGAPPWPMDRDVPFRELKVGTRR